MSYPKAQVQFSGQAESDLADILNYSERRWGERQRRAYSATLEHSFNILIVEPGIGRSRDDIMSGLKSHPIGSHIIYYLPLDDVLLIVRILHARRDPSGEDW